MLVPRKKWPTLTQQPSASAFQRPRPGAVRSEDHPARPRPFPTRRTTYTGSIGAKASSVTKVYITNHKKPISNNHSMSALLTLGVWGPGKINPNISDRLSELTASP